MKFKEKDKIVYCKDNYNKKFDNGEGYYNIGVPHYYKGYLIHKEDGPAIEWNDGGKWWYKEGLLHREDGPAIERKSNMNGWFLDNIQYEEEEYNKIISLKKKKEILNDI